MPKLGINKCKDGAFVCKHLRESKYGGSNDCAYKYGFLRSLPTDGTIPDSCPLLADPERFCLWHQEDEDGSTYNSDCGYHFFFEDGDIESNGFKFCSSCGRPVIEVEWRLEEAEGVTNE
jgi:hypothetical protein